MRHWMRTALATAALGIALTVSAEADPFKIGYLLPNPVGELGWSYELDRGGRAIAEKFGDQVEVQFVNSLGEGPDATRVMNKMAADGVDMLVLGSFGYQQDGMKLAKRYPKLSVVHIGGYMNAPNFSTLTPRHYEAAYLCGMAAGMVTKSETLGVIAAFPLPEVLNVMNAYVLGAQSTNANLKPVKVIWLNSWFDPAMEKASTESLASQGTDVVFSLFPGTPGPMAAAEQLGIYGTVTHSDNSKFAPTKHLCAGQLNFGPVMIKKVEEAMAGNFKGDDVFAGIADNAIAVAGLNKDLSDEQRAQILARQDEMRAGTFKPFTGPITSNQDKEAVPAGTSLDDGAIKGMNFLVKGIDTTIPK
jgi:basic membrane protein A